MPTKPARAGLGLLAASVCCVGGAAIEVLDILDEVEFFLECELDSPGNDCWYRDRTASTGIVDGGCDGGDMNAGEGDLAWAGELGREFGWAPTMDSPA